MNQERIDLSSDPFTGSVSHSSTTGADGTRLGGRPFMGIHFACCNTYLRVYPEGAGKTKTLHCPRCARTLKVEFSETGETARFRQIS